MPRNCGCRRIALLEDDTAEGLAREARENLRCLFGDRSGRRLEMAVLAAAGLMSLIRNSSSCSAYPPAHRMCDTAPT